jgi:ATP-binding cassette subfamily B protein
MNSKSEEIPSHPKTIGAINHLRFSNISLSINLHQVMLFKIFHLRPKQEKLLLDLRKRENYFGKMLVGLYKPAEGAIFYNNKMQ